MDQLKSVITSFVPMADDEYDLIRPFAHRIVVGKNEGLLRYGEVFRHVFFVETGFFRMYYIDEKGNEINTRFSREGEFMVDFVSFITGKASKYQWMAIGDAEVIALERHNIEELYSKTPNWSRFGRLVAEDGYLRVSRRTEMFHFLSPEERYLEILDTQPYLFNRLPLKQLASYIGIQPESLSRLRRRIARK